MESHANSVDDVLVDGLSYKLRNSAKYVVDRRSVTFHPSGSNIYKTTSGTKVLKIHLTGDSWLVPDSVRVMFTLKNEATDAAKRLRTLSGPWCFWRRMRVLCGGQVVEDFDYARTAELFQQLHSEDTRDNDDAEAFGSRYDNSANAGAATTASLPGIPGGSSRRVSFKLFSGLFNQSKWLPIRYCPITLELELVNSATDPVVNPADGDGSVFTTANTSTEWAIEDVNLKCDLASLDNAVDNQIADHLLSGKALPINFQTMITQSQVVSGQSLSVNVSRAVTRLSSIYVSFFGAIANEVRAKSFNTFQHPMLHSAEYSPNFELEYQIQIGSKLFPEYPVTSLAEAFAALRKALSEANGSHYHALSIPAARYSTDKFIIAVQTSKLLAAGFTGLNTRSGDLMTIKVKAAGGGSFNAANHMPTEMHVILESDQILEIRDTGVQVFD